MVQEIFNNNSGHFEAHESYVTANELSSCSYVFYLPHNERCSYVMETADCHYIQTFLDYMNVLFCRLEGLTYLGIIIMIAWATILFLIIVVNSEKIFVPSVLATAKLFRMNEYMIGHIILAWGNEFAYFISNLRKYNHDTELIFNEMLGSSVLVTAFAGGIIFLIRPFELNKEFFLWSMFAYFLSVVCIGIIIYDEIINIYEAIICLLIYIGFFGMIIQTCIRMNKEPMNSTERNREGHVGFSISPRSSLSNTSTLERGPIMTSSFCSAVEYLQRRIQNNPPREPQIPNQAIQVNKNEIECGNSYCSSNRNLCQQFFNHLLSLGNESWSSRNKYRKVFFVISFVVRLLLTLLIPVVDDTQPLDGWCKLGFIFNAILLPLAILFLCKVHHWMWYAIAFGVSLFFLIVVFFTTRTDRPPKWHSFVAILSVTMSIGLVYITSSEFVSCIGALFIIMRIDRVAVAVTVMAWGRSLGDIIANISITLRGHSGAASAACLGGPIFSMLIGFGITAIFRKIFLGVTQARTGAMAYTTIAIQFCLVITSALAIILCGYHGRRSIGIYMIFVYILYLVYAFLIEMEIIHSYGTDHFNEGDMDV